jgi:hypothetical protein
MSVTVRGRTVRLGLAAGVLVLAGLLLGQGALTPRPAVAQIPDSGAQFQQMIAELKDVNRKLDTIVGVLKEIQHAQTGEKKDQGGKAIPKP